MQPAMLHGYSRRGLNPLNVYRLSAPVTKKMLTQLRSGDQVLISGVVYTARDAAHKRLYRLLAQGQQLPVDLRGQIIYYTGPTPAKPSAITGSIGPTTSYRMDPYTPALLEYGVKVIMGKGSRSQSVKDALIQWKGVYLAAIGGAAALLAKSVTSCQVVAYADLGPEAIRRLEVVDFPAIVVNDTYGNDLYLEGVCRYRKESQDDGKD
jgi:fumarate hydratase subunit beta